MPKGKQESSWREQLLKWETSGKSVTAWCLEHQIPVTTFYGWKKRLQKLSNNQSKTEPSQSQTFQNFIELKNEKPSETGITLECDGVKIHLQFAFDSQTLKQCIDCLRGVAC